MKTGKRKTLIIVLLTVFIILLVLLLAFLISKISSKPNTDPKKTNTSHYQETEVEVSDYKEYDWETTGEGGSDGKVFDGRAQTGYQDSSDAENTAQNNATNRLRHNESVNSGIEVNYNSWDSTSASD